MLHQERHGRFDALSSRASDKTRGLVRSLRGMQPELLEHERIDPAIG
jgi:hypothetical protein